MWTLADRLGIGRLRSIDCCDIAPAPSNTRLVRTRYEQASLLSNLGEPLKRSVSCFK